MRFSSADPDDAIAFEWVGLYLDGVEIAGEYRVVAADEEEGYMEVCDIIEAPDGGLWFISDPESPWGMKTRRVYGKVQVQPFPERFGPDNPVPEKWREYFAAAPMVMKVTPTRSPSYGPGFKDYAPSIVGRAHADGTLDYLYPVTGGGQ